jgi:putative ABC transport system substrate-binding protein
LIEPRTIAIEFRWAEARRERFAAIAPGFAQRKVDVIVTEGAAAVAAAQRVTALIPIVFAIASDPVGTGLVTSQARPGGNLLDCRTWGRILLANVLSFRVRCSPVSHGWGSWPTANPPVRCWRCASSMQRPTPMVLQLPGSKFGGSKKSRRHLQRLRIVQMRFMCAPTPLLTPIASASSL